MGFLKPLTDAEKLAKEQRELEKFNTYRAAKKVADAEASRKQLSQSARKKLVPDYAGLRHQQL